MTRCMFCGKETTDIINCSITWRVNGKSETYDTDTDGYVFCLECKDGLNYNFIRTIDNSFESTYKEDITK